MEDGQFYEETKTLKSLGSQDQIIRDISHNVAIKTEQIGIIKVYDIEYYVDLITRGNTKYMILHSDHLTLSSTMTMRNSTQEDVNNLRDVTSTNQPLRIMSYERNGDSEKFDFHQPNMEYFLVAEFNGVKFEQLYALQKIQASVFGTPVIMSAMLPNVHRPGKCCMGASFTTDGCLFNKAEQAFNHFLQNRFNQDLYSDEPIKWMFNVLDATGGHAKTQPVSEDFLKANEDTFRRRFKPSLKILDLL